MPAPRRRVASASIAEQLKARHGVDLTPRRAAALAAIAVTVGRATDAAAARLRLDDQPQDFLALLERPVPRSG